MSESFLDTILFTLLDHPFTMGRMLLLVLGLVGLLLGYYWLRKSLPSFLTNQDVEPNQEKRFFGILRQTAIYFGLFLVVFLTGFDYNLTPNENINFKVSYLLLAVVIFHIARLFEWLTSNIFIHNAFREKAEKTILFAKRQTDSSEHRITRIGRFFVYTLMTNFLIELLKLDFTIFSRNLNNGLVFEFRLSNIFLIILIIFGTQLLIWMVTQIVLRSIYTRNNLNEGAAYAIDQLFKYVVWTMAVFFGLEMVGLDVTLLLGGAAALLVGVGLGLQNTFNDFISGVILLGEQSVKVGDVLEGNGFSGRVKKIGLRSSIVETFDLTSVIVPNKELVNRDVVNWTHDTDKRRFSVSLGVAYGSDTALVKKLLLGVAKENPYVIKYPSPFIRFENFGESELSFSLYFFSRNYMVIEDIKSDIRFEIDRIFRENGVEIPFPQRDVYMK